MIKKAIALILALALCLAVAACGSASQPAAPRYTSEPVHKIGVIVYNTGDEEVIGFREYLQGYIESNFQMVQFVYSGSITTPEEELDFIQKACDEGVEGFMSFLSQDLAAEVALCEQNKAYYLLASGTVSDEAFDAVADNPWFLGVFGPGKAFEFQAGADMARFFAEQDVGNRYFILSGGAPMGNEMHYQRTLGILNAFALAYGVSYSVSREELAKTDQPVTLTLDDKLTVTICPGYVSRASFLETAKRSYADGSYDAVLSVLPPAEMIGVIGKTPLGVVDAFHTRNLQLFNDGTLRYCIGKYSSMVGPAFALMLNAVTGYADDFRLNGKAVRVTQGFWVAESAEDYAAKYTLSSSASKNAYSFEDLVKVIRIYNPDATLIELMGLAEACSYFAVEARRSMLPTTG